jgi:EmrB/QacA subfamily drug resistance transporter
MTAQTAALPVPETRTDRLGGRAWAALLVLCGALFLDALDVSMIGVALPSIDSDLHMSTTSLQWVVSAYVLGYGGFLLLGGRAADLLGRRRMFVIGLLLFSAASLAGELATSQAWLLAARTVQGAAGAIVAPAALSLITATFPEGPRRGRAMGVYAAMSGAGGAVGLLAGGLLVTYASWRWVLFVNVPIGVAILAPMALAAAPRAAGRFDLPGAITGTGGISSLVYGLSEAATTPDGVSHWGDAKVVAALTAGVLLLAAFAAFEARGRHALLPPRLLRSRERLGANLIMLGAGTAIFGVFFFLTLFVQDVWGYSALRTGVSFLPLTVALVVAAGVAARLVSRTGPRPLLVSGAAACAGGMLWLAQVTEHGTYAGELLGPSLLIGVGLGLLFMPLPLVALAGVGETDSGVAASLLNTGRQVGGSIRLAILGTVAWTVVADSMRAAVAGGARPDGRAAAYTHALAAGFDRAFLVAAGIAVLILAAAVAAIRIRRDDLRGS